jgi:ricin-type beta-trefoil lectin protein
MTIKRILRTVVGLLVLAATLVAVRSPAVAAPAARGPYIIVGFDSQKCLDDPNYSLKNHKNMIIWDCTGRSNQLWDFVDTAGPYDNIRVRSSGKCLTVRNARITDNEPVIQYDCNTGDNEEWEPRFVGKDHETGWDYYNLVNRQSEMCLTVKNASTVNGAKLLQFTCGNDDPHQLWTWVGR